MVNISPLTIKGFCMSETNKSGDVDLRSVRESRGVTLEAMSRMTKIRRVFLEGIETGDFHVLPERIYGEAFIKSYAAQVGVDPGPIIARYRKFLKMPEPEQVQKKPDKAANKALEGKKEAKPEKPVPAVVDAGPRPAEKPQSVTGSRSLPRKRFSRMAVSLVLSAAVICGGFLYFLLSDEPPRPEQVALKERQAAPAPSGLAKTDQPAAGSQQTEGSPAPGTAPASAPAQPAEVKPAASQSNKLVIQASELTWISITEDENQSYQIMLRPGDNLERVAGRFVIDIGNAGGISLNLNGEDLGVPGQRGQVVHLILPREKPPE